MALTASAGSSFKARLAGNKEEIKVIINVIVGSGNLSDFITKSKINIGGKTVRSNKISSLAIVNY